MLPGEIGAVILFLMAVCIFGHIWFCLVESVMEKIKSLFVSRKEPECWHPILPPENHREEDHPEGKEKEGGQPEEKQPEKGYLK